MESNSSRQAKYQNIATCMAETQESSKPEMTPPPDEFKQLRSLYVNGFGIAIGNADVTIILQNNGKSVLLLNLSYTVAKSLSQKVSEVVQLLEKASGRTVMTSDEVLKFLAKTQQKDEKN